MVPWFSCGVRARWLEDLLQPRDSVILVKGWPGDKMFPTRAMQRAKITFLNMLATLFLMEHKIPFVFFAMRLHCWLMFNLLLTRALKSFFAGPHFSCLTPWGTSAQNPDAGFCISLCWTSCSSWSISPACWGPAEWHPNHLAYQQLLAFHPLQTWGCCSSVIHLVSHFIIECYQVCEAWYLLCKYILFIPNHLILNVPGNGFRNCMQDYFSRDWGEADYSLVLKIFLLEDIWLLLSSNPQEAPLITMIFQLKLPLQRHQPAPLELVWAFYQFLWI